MTDIEYINARVKEVYPNTWLKNLTNTTSVATSIDEDTLNAAIADAIGYYNLYYSTTYTQGSKHMDMLMAKITVMVLRTQKDSGVVKEENIVNFLKTARVTKVCNGMKMTSIEIDDDLESGKWQKLN